MDTATLNSPAVQRQSAHGVVRWCGAPPAADNCLLEVGGGLLEITPLLSGGYGSPVCYWVRVEKDAAGKVVGYTLTRCDGTGAYSIDTSFGVGPEHWTCDCRDSDYNPCKICKHRISLFVALRRVGLLTEAGGVFGR